MHKGGWSSSRLTFALSFTKAFASASDPLRLLRIFFFGSTSCHTLHPGGVHAFSAAASAPIEHRLSNCTPVRVCLSPLPPFCMDAVLLCGAYNNKSRLLCRTSAAVREKIYLKFPTRFFRQSTGRPVCWCRPVPAAGCHPLFSHSTNVCHERLTTHKRFIF